MNPSKESAAAILFSSLAAVVQTFAPTWLFVGLILLSMTATIIGLVKVQRREQKRRLIAAMDAAFGQPTDKKIGYGKRT